MRFAPSHPAIRRPPLGLTRVASWSEGCRHDSAQPSSLVGEYAHRLHSLTTKDLAIREVKRALDRARIEMPAEIVALQATPSLRAAITGDAEVTPGGGVRPRPDDTDD